jgi:hypothetical protein
MRQDDRVLVHELKVEHGDLQAEVLEAVGHGLHLALGIAEAVPRHGEISTDGLQAARHRHEGGKKRWT